MIKHYCWTSKPTYQKCPVSLRQSVLTLTRLYSVLQCPLKTIFSKTLICCFPFSTSLSRFRALLVHFCTHIFHFRLFVVIRKVGEPYSLFSLAFFLYILSVIRPILNSLYFQSRGGRFWINEDTQFKDLAELIHHHSLNSSGLVTTLTHPVPNVSFT